MAGDQKTAAQKRTEAFLKADPDHFKKLAAKRKGKENPSTTKFKKGSKRSKLLGSKGGKQKRRTPEEMQRDHEKAVKKIAKQNDKANAEFQNSYHKKFVKEGFKGKS